MKVKDNYILRGHKGRYNWFLVKARAIKTAKKSYYYGYIVLESRALYLPKRYIGKRVRLKIEEIK